MNIKQLHYFYELAQHRHFAKAAKACFITQPTLSASITALEKSLGTELVVRNSQFVALTQAGEVVLHHAERMLQEQDAMRQELSLFRGGLSGALRIGVVPQSSIDIMPLLKGFNDAYPKVGLHLCVMTHATLMEQLDCIASTSGSALTSCSPSISAGPSTSSFATPTPWPCWAPCLPTAPRPGR